ncbi:MAG: DUF4388 domain-containing protein, partial [Deinococcales bacterium]
MSVQALARGLVKDFGLENLFLQLSEHKFTGRLTFNPSSLEFYFDRGDLIAAKGAEPLGSILLRLGAVTVSQLQTALSAQGTHSLGEVLLSAMFGLNPNMLEDALQIQIFRAIQRLLEDSPSEFAVFNHENDLPIQTRLPVQIAFAEVMPSVEANTANVEEFSAQTVVKLLTYLPAQAVQLEPDQWAVATLLDGRRNLETVARFYQIQFPRIENPDKRTFSAILKLYHLGLIEPVEYKLEQIFLKGRSGKQLAYV